MASFIIMGGTLVMPVRLIFEIGISRSLLPAEMKKRSEDRLFVAYLHRCLKRCVVSQCQQLGVAIGR